LIESEFQDVEGPEARRSSHVVQAIDHAAGKLGLGLDVTHQQLAVSAQSAGYLS
jgi:hypothetical protein